MSRGKKAYMQFEKQLSEAIARLSLLREELKERIDADAESYNQVMAAYKLAKTSADGDDIIDAALKGATQVPFEIAQRAGEVGELLQSLRPITSTNMASDLTVGGELAEASKQGALANVDINLASIKDASFVAGMRSKVEALGKVHALR
jgi:formiminotetrahydrofolate cyclodeaminase